MIGKEPSARMSAIVCLFALVVPVSKTIHFARLVVRPDKVTNVSRVSLIVLTEYSSELERINRLSAKTRELSLSMSHLGWNLNKECWIFVLRN